MTNPTPDDLLSDRELYDLYMYQPHNDALRAIAHAQHERTVRRYEEERGLLGERAPLTAGALLDADERLGLSRAAYAQDSKSLGLMGGAEMIQAMVQRIETAEARIAELEADKARLDWLDSPAVEGRISRMDGVWWVFNPLVRRVDEGDQPFDNLRAAIDAAREEGK